MEVPRALWSVHHRNPWDLSAHSWCPHPQISKSANLRYSFTHLLQPISSESCAYHINTMITSQIDVQQHCRDISRNKYVDDGGSRYGALSASTKLMAHLDAAHQLLSRVVAKTTKHFQDSAALGPARSSASAARAPQRIWCKTHLAPSTIIMHDTGAPVLIVAS